MSFLLWNGQMSLLTKSSSISLASSVYDVASIIELIIVVDNWCGIKSAKDVHALRIGIYSPTYNWLTLTSV